MSSADIRGRFVWHELATTDVDGAKAFYSKVAPWKASPSGMPTYTLWTVGTAQAGGLMELPRELQSTGVPPHWLMYVGTADVDATQSQAKSLGAQVLRGAMDIPNVGRFAVLKDPQGAVFALFKTMGAPPGGGPLTDVAGEFSWHELATTDVGAALDFYAALFGWSKGPAHDMGDRGVYQIIEHGGQPVGGIFKAPANYDMPPNWLCYVHVADVGKAVNAVKAAGGRVLNGPMEVPGGSWIAQIQDPQGAAIALQEPAAAAEAPAARRSARASAAPRQSAPAQKQPSQEGAKKPAQKRETPMKSAAKRAPAKKAPAKKAAGKKASRKKTAARKPAAKKASRRAAKRPAGRKRLAAKKKAAKRKK